MANDFLSAVDLEAISTATLSGTFQLVIPGGLEEACVAVILTNQSDNTVFVSYDGVNDHEVVRPFSDKNLPPQTNSQPNNKKAFFRKGQEFWVRSVTNNAGAFFISGYYL